MFFTCLLTLPDAIALRGGHFGAGDGPIHIDNFFCRGNEESLLDCIHDRSEGCTHNQDASVICNGEYLVVMCLVM